MRFRFEVAVGLRYMKAKRKQALISVISSFSVLGVMLGVMTLIIVLRSNERLRKRPERKDLGYCFSPCGYESLQSVRHRVE